MRVLVTRPEPQATAWAKSLQDSGIAAAALPLIDISAPKSPQAVRDTWARLREFRAVMFVSPAAVDWFFRLRPPSCMWPASTLALAPGPGTAAVVRQHGQPAGLSEDQLISPGAEAPQFDSETLWPLLAPIDWNGQKVCIASGGDGAEARGRTWLAQQWMANGATVHVVLTYQRGAAQWSDDQQALVKQALDAPETHLWLFSSSEAIELLAHQLIPRHVPTLTPNWRTVRAVVTHPRIAERARELGMTKIIQTKPSLTEVVQALRAAP